MTTPGHSSWLLAALALTLLGSCTQLTDAVHIDQLNNDLPTKSEKTERYMPSLCSVPTLSHSPSSSVHSLSPSDIAVVSAMGLPLSHRSQASGVLSRLAELLSMFNPEVTTLPLDQASVSSPQHRRLLEQAEDLALSLSHHQAIDVDRVWRLVMLFVPADTLCACSQQATADVDAIVQDVERALQMLQRKLRHTLVHVVVWSGHSDVGSPPRDKLCHCTEDTKSKQRLQKAILTKALQESLDRLLVQQHWYSENEDFTVHLQSSPVVTEPISALEGSSSSDPNQLALQLWTNLLQPMRGQMEVKDDDTISIPCPSEELPFLRTQFNSLTNSQGDVQASRNSMEGSPLLDPVMGSELPCMDRSPSPTPPSSVHELRPGDIKLVAALGDSLTAANGVGAKTDNILLVINEYRGLSWCIGGDENLTTVTTLPNILKEFNPLVTGFSIGQGGEDTAQAFLNQAVPGAKSDDMTTQVRVLVEKMKNDSRIDFQNDWKVITMFIAGNDVCDYCGDSVYFSPNNIVGRIREALDILHKEVPRALVNLVELMDMIPLRRLHQDKSLGCPTWMVNILCRCVTKPTEGSVELQTLTGFNRAYQSGMRDLVESGRYDTHANFTVVLQPFFREVVLPLLEDGRPDRSYFSPDCFHLSQKAHSLMARALWNNMLEPVGNKTFTQDFTADLPLKCPSTTVPFLRTAQNSNYTYKVPPPINPPATDWGSDFSCLNTAPSDIVPTSVHRIRPGDIKVVAALGDSITAGFGAKAKNLLQLATEYRGVSWSIGGDKTLATVTTLPNILRKFNPDVYGMSKGQNKRQTGFNVAVSGAKVAGIPRQVRSLIDTMKNNTRVDFEKDWKLVTLFIGGNDLCQYCNDRASLSPKNYSSHLKASLDLLYKEVPRVMVHILEILQIEGLRKIKRNTLGCSLVQENVCPCFIIPGEDSPELSEMKRINREFQEETEKLIYGGHYDGREDFAVVLQPYFHNSIVPMNSEGTPELTYFSVDCFHFSDRGHAEMAIALWNNMLEPVGQKQNYNNFTNDRGKIQCPTEDHPYIFTSVNSVPSGPTTTAPSTPNTAAPFNPPCSDNVPAWAAAVLAVVGLVIGWGVTWVLLSCREKRNRKKMQAVVEMKATGF